MDEESEEYISMIVSNGLLVWECNKVTCTNIPPARKSQKWSVYLPLLLSVLRGTKDVDITYNYKFDIEISSLTFTITEPMKGGESLFFMLELQLSKNQEISMRNLLVLSAKTMAKYSDEITQEYRKNSKLKETIGMLESRLAKIADDKDILQNDMMRKMCVLLNSRSSEIRRLRAIQGSDESDLDSMNSERVALNNDLDKPELKFVQGAASSSLLQQEDKLLKPNHHRTYDSKMISPKGSIFLDVNPEVVNSDELLKSLTQIVSQSQSDALNSNIRSSSSGNRDNNNGNNGSSSSCRKVESGGSGTVALSGSQHLLRNKRQFSTGSDDEDIRPLLSNTTTVKKKKKKMADSDSDSDID